MSQIVKLSHLKTKTENHIFNDEFCFVNLNKLVFSVNKWTVECNKDREKKRNTVLDLYSNGHLQEQPACKRQRPKQRVTNKYIYISYMMHGPRQTNLHVCN